MADQFLISFVTPLFNEQECLPELYARIKTLVDKLGQSFELVCVDDGSTDSTLECLMQLRSRDERVRIVALSRNFGHQAAVLAGLQYATGHCVVVLDGDLQDPPEAVAEMFTKWLTGFQVVYGVRRNRKEGILLRGCYPLFYRFLSLFSDVKLPLDAGDFCLMDQRVVRELRQFPEYRPYIRGLRAWVGFSQTGVEYDRPARHRGQSKYGYWKLLRLGLDGIMSFSDVLLNWAILWGFLVTLAALGYGSYIAIHRLLAMAAIVELQVLPGWTSIACLITFLMGLQFIYLGVMGKYLGRTFMQTKNRPHYVVKAKVGIDDGTI